MRSSKKSIIALVLCVLLLLPMASMLTLGASAASKTIPAKTVYVDLSLSGDNGKSVNFSFGGENYTAKLGETAFSSLSAAIKASSAGGTILLAPGTYSEGVTIDKDLTILGPKAGIDPNVRGAGVKDDWTRSPERGSGEAILTTSWHMGINANDKKVYDCHNITVDGITVSGAGMFRSNYGEAGSINLVYRNIIVTGYTTKNNGPFYCYSYYPDRATNSYLRNVTAENIRFEGHTTAPGFNLTVESFTASGIYFDSASTGQCFGSITCAASSASKAPLNVSITDSMFRQKVNQVLNINFKTSAGGSNFNATIAQREKVTATVEGCVFIDNDSKAASNNNIIVPQTDTDNVYFNIKNNYFIQTSPAASDNFIAIHGATSALPLGDRVIVTQNRFIGIPTALNIPASTTDFDLSGNYFASADGVPAKPVVASHDKTSWWYLDEAMTRDSRNASDVLDGKIISGTVDEAAHTVRDSVSTADYTFKLSTAEFNTLHVYADPDMTRELGSTVHLYNKETKFYLKVASMSGNKTATYTATITTTAPDTAGYDLENEVRFFGRTYAENGNYFFNWSASGFTFSFKGSGASATILSNAPGGSNTAYIKIYVDGEFVKDVALTEKSQKVTLASGLDPAREHTVKVLKRTNARSSSAAVSEIRLTDGTKLSPEPPKDRLIEFIGDSLTVGYVATPAGSRATAWSTATEDVTGASTTSVAEAFRADYNVVAISGRGIVRNTDGSTDRLLPAIYPNLDEYNAPGVAYDFASQPDVIVINLGTNDASGKNSSLTDAEFKAGVIAFLKDVRKYNPNAEIIYAYGLTATKFASVIESVVGQLNKEGDSHIHFLRLSTCSSSEKAVGHPTIEGYAPRTEAIIEKISEVTGWKDVRGEEPDETDVPGTTEPAVETTAPSDSDAETTEARDETTKGDEDVKKSGGCGSSVGLGSALALLLTVLGCALTVLCKKVFG